MRRGSWKRVESKVAKKFGTERTPLSGISSKHTGSDTLHEKYYIEVRSRKAMTAFTWWREIVPRAKQEGKEPILVLHQTGTKLYLKVIPLDRAEEGENE